jgi:hypothetical protein
MLDFSAAVGFPQARCTIGRSRHKLLATGFKIDLPNWPGCPLSSETRSPDSALKTCAVFPETIASHSAIRHARLLSLESPTPRSRTCTDRLSENSREVTLVAEAALHGHIR